MAKGRGRGRGGGLAQQEKVDGDAVRARARDQELVGAVLLSAQDVKDPGLLSTQEALPETQSVPTGYEIQWVMVYDVCVCCVWCRGRAGEQREEMTEAATRRERRQAVSRWSGCDTGNHGRTRLRLVYGTMRSLYAGLATMLMDVEREGGEARWLSATVRAEVPLPLPKGAGDTVLGEQGGVLESARDCRIAQGVRQLEPTQAH